MMGGLLGRHLAQPGCIVTVKRRPRCRAREGAGERRAWRLAAYEPVAGRRAGGRSRLSRTHRYARSAAEPASRPLLCPQAPNMRGSCSPCGLRRLWRGGARTVVAQRSEPADGRARSSGWPQCADTWKLLAQRRPEQGAHPELLQGETQFLYCIHWLGASIHGWHLLTTLPRLPIRPWLMRMSPQPLARPIPGLCTHANMDPSSWWSPAR